MPLAMAWGDRHVAESALECTLGPREVAGESTFWRRVGADGSGEAMEAGGTCSGGGREEGLSERDAMLGSGMPDGMLASSSRPRS